MSILVVIQRTKREVATWTDPNGGSTRTSARSQVLENGDLLHHMFGPIDPERRPVVHLVCTRWHRMAHATWLNHLLEDPNTCVYHVNHVWSATWPQPRRHDFDLDVCVKYNQVAHLDLCATIGEHASKAVAVLPNLRSLYLSVVGGFKREDSLVVLPSLPHLTFLRLEGVLLPSFSLLNLPNLATWTSWTSGSVTG